jgi:hypothetical protein
MLQLLMLFLGMLMYLEPKLFLLIIFYNLYLFINYKNFNCTQYLFMYVSFHCIMVGMTAQIEWLLSKCCMLPCFVCVCVCFFISLLMLTL